MSSQLTSFYLELCTDCEGRTLQEIWQHRDDWFEACHDYIQWLFPSTELSNFNENAPILTEEDIALFNSNPQLMDNLSVSFFRFLKFLGLEYSQEDNEIVKGDNYRETMFSRPNHNWFRISRVLKSLKLLGLEDYALTFYRFLERIHTVEQLVTENTFLHWKEAVQ